MRKIPLIVAAVLVVAFAAHALDVTSSRPVQLSDGSTAEESIVVSWTDNDGDTKYPDGADIYSRGTATIRVRAPYGGGDVSAFQLLPGDSYVYAGKCDTVLIVTQTDIVEVRGLMR